MVATVGGEHRSSSRPDRQLEQAYQKANEQLRSEGFGAGVEQMYTIDKALRVLLQEMLKYTHDKPERVEAITVIDTLSAGLKPFIANQNLPQAIVELNVTDVSNRDKITCFVRRQEELRLRDGTTVAPSLIDNHLSVVTYHWAENAPPPTILIVGDQVRDALIEEIGLNQPTPEE